MNALVPAIILVVLSISLWVFWFSYRSSGKKKLLENFRVIAEKYNFELDESGKSGDMVLPLLRGIYKKHPLEIGCIKNPQAKDSCSTYIKVVCRNSKDSAFALRAKGKEISLPPDAVSLMDAEFDEKFTVTANSASFVISLFTFNIKYSLLQAQNFGLKGELKLTGAELNYTEPELIRTENSRARIELVMHILCDMADELEKY